MFDLGPDDDSMRQVQHLGCLGLIFHSQRYTSYVSKKTREQNPHKTLLFAYSMFMLYTWGARCLMKILQVLMQPFCGFVHAGLLELPRGDLDTMTCKKGACTEILSRYLL